MSSSRGIIYTAVCGKRRFIRVAPVACTDYGALAGRAGAAADLHLSRPDVGLKGELCQPVGQRFYAPIRTPVVWLTPHAHALVSTSVRVCHSDEPLRSAAAIGPLPSPHVCMYSPKCGVSMAGATKQGDGADLPGSSCASLAPPSDRLTHLAPSPIVRAGRPQSPRIECEEGSRFAA